MTITFAPKPDGSATELLHNSIKVAEIGPGGLGSEGVAYTPAGVGAVATDVQSKLRESVSVLDFMTEAERADVLSKTGSLDVTNAIQKALNTGKSVHAPSGKYFYDGNLNFIADDQCLFGDGYDTVFKSGAGSKYIYCSGKKGCVIRDLKIDGDGTNAGILVTGGAELFKVSNVYFYRGNQRVLLFTCSKITVESCVFEETGYGVIQQSNNVSSHVLVTGCLVKNYIYDFVEANCTSSAPSESWTISNNICTGALGWPDGAALEKRFVGITSVRGVIITGNQIHKTLGDAAIHLEDTLGDTIVSNNVFDNCVNYSQSGYIYLLSSHEHIVITGNIFLRTDTSLPLAYGVANDSADFNANTLISNNRFAGNGASGNFSGVFDAVQANTQVVGNSFYKLVMGIRINAVTGCSYLNNYFLECNFGIYNQRHASSSPGNHVKVSGNYFRSTVGQYDIFAMQNINGTLAPKHWTVTDNIFSKEFCINGLPGGSAGSTSDAYDITITNNVFKDGASLNTQGTMSRLIRFGNVFQSTAGNNSSVVSILPNFADDAAAAAANVPIGGMYRNGSIVQVRTV